MLFLAQLGALVFACLLLTHFLTRRVRQPFYRFTDPNLPSAHSVNTIQIGFPPAFAVALSALVDSWHARLIVGFFGAVIPASTYTPIPSPGVLQCILAYGKSVAGHRVLVVGGDPTLVKSSFHRSRRHV